jgi:aldehyde:ferredoxin oxidoreductase
MEVKGYTGKILYVDLSSEEITVKDLDLNLARNFIGDYGIGAKLAYDLIKPGTDPLSPSNFIIVGAGPLTGTSIPASSRCHVYTKFPLTNTIGCGGGPMSFSSRLKWAGYDELIITGRAYRPVYLKISDDNVEILDAKDLWGKDIFEATDKIWDRHGTTNGVICIGQAGENLVKSALCLIDKNGTVGRFGIGAVMGSKNLKLITTGGKHGISIADKARYISIVNQMTKEIENWPIRDEFINLGHLEYDFDGLVRVAGVTKYYTDDVDLPTMRERFGPEVYLSRIKKQRLACPACLVACRNIDEIKQGEYKGTTTFQQSTVHSHGEHLDLPTMEDNIKMMDTLQRYGLDRYAYTMGTEFLMYLCEKGIVPKEDLEGIEYGNTKILLKIAEKMALREGIGNILADGLEGFVKKYGREVERHGVYVKNVDMYMDARKTKLGTFQIDFVVNPFGPNNGKGGMLNPGKFNPAATEQEFRVFCKERMAMSEDEINRVVLDSPLKINMAKLLKHTQDYYVTLNCLGMCMRVHSAQFYGIARLAELYSAVTGIEIDQFELKRAAERSYNVVKALNVREGLSREDDRFPKIWLKPLKAGGKEIPLKSFFGDKVLSEEDLEKVLDDYYSERGWDVETGIPTKAKLKELGLEDIIEDLENNGYDLPQ